jgi:hypothetical protein
LRTSLMQETMDRLGTSKRDTAMIPRADAPHTCVPIQEPTLPTSRPCDDKVESFAAVREGGGLHNFPGKAGQPLH